MSQPLPITDSTNHAPARSRGRVRRLLRRTALVLGILAALLAAVAAGGALWVRNRLQASLAQEEGRHAIPGLAAPVAVARDAFGVPTIGAASRADAARALGFLHAQERYFQMDLLRRQAAGELAELFGDVAIEIDQKHRLHRLRAVARRVLAVAPPEERALLDAYAGGVLAGLEQLGAEPWEYAVLRSRPAPWTSEDTVLATLAMFLEIEDPDGVESELGLMRDLLPPAMFEFLTAGGTEWDAPLMGGPVAPPSMPGTEVFDLRSPAWAPKTQAADLRREILFPDLDSAVPAGSNAWAVAGLHTADGRALLANDMHLSLGVPNIWYRASIVRPDGHGGELRVTGLTLPGTPLIAVGSTGRIAWGFTNSFVDWHDLVVVETDPRRPDTYLTPQGPRPFEHHLERIRVKGGEDRTLDVRTTIWGPVIDQDHQGRPRALAWIGHRPEAVNFRLVRLEAARDVDEAIEIAHGSGIPLQNFVVADSGGHIGWTIVGRLPRRVGFDGRLPSSWADGSRRWDGWLASQEVPSLVDPPSGRIWTANNRLVSGEALTRLGDGGYWLGARAQQIRDQLLRIDKATPGDMLALQLDDRALFLERWRKVLLDSLTPAALDGQPGRRQLRRVLETTWTGRASVDSPAYRFVRAFHEELLLQVFSDLTARCKEADERFDLRDLRQLEGPLWILVQKRPIHLLDPRFKTWDEQILAVADELIEYYGAEQLAQRTWGERNTVSIRHPLSQSVPLLGRWIDVPPRQLPGDQDMPRFQGPSFGASQRIVVSPGREEAGFFEMPAGQSGNPLSPHYRDGQEVWEENESAPFLPGPAVSTLHLVPLENQATAKAATHSLGDNS